VEYVRQEVIPSGWQDLGVIETADVAWATTEFAKVVAENIASTIALQADIPHGAANVEMRFYGTATNEDSNVLNIYGRRKDDGYYTLLATLTLVTGTAQKGAATELWVHNVTETKDYTPQGGAVISPDDNTIGRYYFKPSGYEKLMIIATTLVSTNIGVEIASYSG